jgi:hypothetical protein
MLQIEQTEQTKQYTLDSLITTHAFKQTESMVYGLYHKNNAMDCSKNNLWNLIKTIDKVSLK